MFHDVGFIIFSFFQTIPFQILHGSIKQLTGFRDIKDMEDSDELFDYIADLPSDNVLEICNFVLIGGGAGEGVERRDEAGEVQDPLGSEESSVEHYNNFVEILDFQGGNTNNNNNNNNNNNSNEKVIENTLNEGQLKVKSLTT